MAVTAPYRGWYVVGFCFLMAVFGWGLGFYGPGFYLLELSHLQRWPAGQISVATTAYFLYGAALITVLPIALRRWAARRVVLAGVIAMGVSSAAVPAVTALWQLYAVYLVMAVGWATMSSTAIAAMLAPWFTRHRGLALSLALTGANVGGMVIVPALVPLAGRWGFLAATRAAAALMLALLAPAAWIVLRRTAARPPVAGDSARSPGRLPALRQVRFWSVTAPFALALAAQIGFLNQQLVILDPLLGPGRAALAASVTAAAALLGRIGLSLAIDHVNLRWAAASVFTVQAAGLLILALSSGTSALPDYLACAVFGLSVGNVVTLPALLIQQEFGAVAFTQVLSLCTALGQITYAFGPVLLAIIRESTGQYRPALAACIGLEAAAAVMVRTIRTRSPPGDCPDSNGVPARSR